MNAVKRDGMVITPPLKDLWLVGGTMAELPRIGEIKSRVARRVILSC